MLMRAKWLNMKKVTDGKKAKIIELLCEGQCAMKILKKNTQNRLINYIYIYIHSWIISLNFYSDVGTLLNTLNELLNFYRKVDNQITPIHTQIAISNNKCS